jgi:fumarate reductase subunit C
MPSLDQTRNREMETAVHSTENPFTRRLLVWSAPVVVGHFLVVLWHLFLLVKVDPNTPRFLPPLLILINLIPLAGLFVFARGFFKVAASMIAIPLGVALVIGGYSHFLSHGSDNVFRMRPGECTLSYQISAVLLVILEALGCWISVRMVANTKTGPTKHGSRLRPAG